MGELIHLNLMLCKLLHSLAAGGHSHYHCTNLSSASFYRAWIALCVSLRKLEALSLWDVSELLESTRDLVGVCGIIIN